MSDYYMIEGLNPHGDPCLEHKALTLEEVKEWHKKHAKAHLHSVSIYSSEGELKEVIYQEWFGEVKIDKMTERG